MERLPTSYSSSIFFTDNELEVCAGASLYTITKQLQQRIEDDYRDLVVRVLVQHPDLFPLNKFTLHQPFADMLDHSASRSSAMYLSVLAGKDYEAGDQNLWALAGLDLTCTISLTLTNPLPKIVIRYLRIQRLDESNLASIALRQAADEKISNSNEVQVLQSLVELIASLLGSFGT
ncbi:hypothetical protein E5D57_003612 [Metarhizium anisopliae]|nr:hypothetical protein E5D57_003612 [Metarhizium anisopliae]